MAERGSIYDNDATRIQRMIDAAQNTPAAQPLSGGIGGGGGRASSGGGDGTASTSGLRQFYIDSSNTPTGTNISGALDGANADFDLPDTPTGLILYVNGQRQSLVPGKDYTLSGTTITFVVAPEVDGEVNGEYWL